MKKTIIYQVLPRYWGKVDAANEKNGNYLTNGSGKFDDFDNDFFDYMKWLGCSYVWYTGVLSHAMKPFSNEELAAFDDSQRERIVKASSASYDGRSAAEFVKGRAGSPYAVCDYYDVAPYLGTIDDFRNLISRTHHAGLKCLIDFIPNHIAPNYSDVYGGIPHCFRCDYDWTDTVKIDYNHPDTWEKMYRIVRYWAEKGVDGFRCDMVELVPREFFTWLIRRIKAEFPSVIFVAEIYNRDNYWAYIREVGFDLLYDKSGLYDINHALICKNSSMLSNDPSAEWASAKSITWNWQRLGDLQSNMLNFLENHDEKRIASPAFAMKGSRALAALAVSAAFNDAAFMIYAGQETGEKGMEDAGMSGPDGRSTIYDWWTPEYVCKLKAMLKHKSYESLSINEIVTANDDSEKSHISVKEAELFCRYALLLRFLSDMNDRSYDLCYCQSDKFDTDSCFAFLRGNHLFVCNFSGVKKHMHINIPDDACNYFNMKFPQRVFITVPAFDFSVMEF